jgi:PAS domain S-box-containing protein
MSTRMPDEPEGPATPTTWSEGRFRALMLHSGDIISVLDAQGRLLYNSPAAERISGYRPDELAGLDTFELIHPDDQARVAEVFQRVLAAPGAVATVQYRYRAKAGGWTWMEAVASNQLHDPEVRGIVANSRDVTERREAEAERERLEEQLSHRQRLESLGTLAGGIAHDFNNLLGALFARVELAQQATAEPVVLAELKGAQQALERASELTRQLLGIARRQPTRPEVLDLGAMLERLLPLLERVLGGRIRVGLSAPATPAWIRVDPAQLEQVVVNLATNARDAMPGGGQVQLDLSVEPASPGGDRGWALLRVQDDGFGLSKDDLARAFEPFFTTKEVGKGTGLGLTVSHGIVTQAGGTIRLESQPGAGTTALVRLPLAEPPARDTRPAGQAPAAGRARPGERLLLADDDDLVRSAVRRMLLRLGWEVDEVRDGLEVLERVAQAPQAYAAAILDVRMPRLGGPEAARRLARTAPGLPVLLVSGFTEGAERLEGMLQKPFTSAALGAKVRQIIDGSAGPRPAGG